MVSPWTHVPNSHKYNQPSYLNTPHPSIRSLQNYRFLTVIKITNHHIWTGLIHKISPLFLTVIKIGFVCHTVDFSSFYCPRKDFKNIEPFYFWICSFCFSVVAFAWFGSLAGRFAEGQRDFVSFESSALDLRDKFYYYSMSDTHSSSWEGLVWFEICWSYL